MNKRVSIIFIILFLTFALFTFNFKGYLNIRAYTAEKRSDIETFMNLKYLNSSFIATQDSDIKNSITEKFDDVANLNVKKNIDFSVSLKIVNKVAFGKIAEGVYLDDKGYIFYSNLIFDKDLPNIVIKDFSKNSSYLSEDQMSFIKKLTGYPKLTVYLLSPYGFEVIADNYSIEVPTNFTKMELMADFANSEIKKSNNDFKKLVVLKDKIVFKN